MQSFQNILVVVDGALDRRAALSEAIEVAEQDGAKLKIVDVVREFGWLQRITTSRWRDLQAGIAAAKEQQLRRLASEIRRRGVDVQCKVLVGRSSTEIVREVQRDEHDLVMKDVKGEGWFKGFFGATGMQLLRKCPCPVWLVHRGGVLAERAKPDAGVSAVPGEPDAGRLHEHDQSVMAAIDASCTDEAHANLNRKILELATGLCQRHHKRLEIVQAWSAFGEDVLQHHMPEDEFQDLIECSRSEAENCLNDLLRGLGLSAADNLYVHLLHGDPGLVIPHFAQHHQIDLIVIGTIARSGVAGSLTGNMAESILGNVKCSVLAVKPDGFVSPISAED